MELDGADMSQAQAVLPSMTPEQTGVVGTSFYISPEINEGWPQHDEKVKIRHATSATIVDLLIHCCSWKCCWAAS